jgi:hypothetical protein
MFQIEHTFFIIKSYYNNGHRGKMVIEFIRLVYV